MNNDFDLNTGTTTPGLSANTSGLDQADQYGWSRRRLSKFAAAFAALFVLALVVVLYSKSLSSLTAKTLKNGDYTYAFSFYNSAEEVKIEDGRALRHGDKVTVQIQPTKDTYLASCTQIGRAWRTVFTVRIEGKERPVCSTNNQSYYTNFEKYDQRHMFSLTYGEEQTDLQTVEAIIQSVKAAR
jgi:hypothetical protein